LAGPRQGSGHATLPDVIRMMRSVADEEGLSPPHRTHEAPPGPVGNEVGQDLDLPVTWLPGLTTLRQSRQKR
jgi:hypothetical protein